MCAENGERFAEIIYKVALQTANVWHFRYYPFLHTTLPSVMEVPLLVRHAKNGLSCPPTPVAGLQLLAGLKQTDCQCCSRSSPPHFSSLLQKFCSRQCCPGFWSSLLAHWAPCVWKVRSAWRQAGWCNTGPTVCAHFLSASVSLKDTGYIKWSL